MPHEVRVKFEIRNNDTVIGTSSFERADPPMGFVIGDLSPTEEYNISENYSDLTVNSVGLPEALQCDSVTIEDLSLEMGEQTIEVTVLLESSEEFDKYFSHHRDSYEKQFS